MRVTVLLVILVTLPVPLMLPAYVPPKFWSKTRAALSTMLPWSEVVVPVKVPAEIVVPPL